jgi:hypothetical protein
VSDRTDRQIGRGTVRGDVNGFVSHLGLGTRLTRRPDHPLECLSVSSEPEFSLPKRGRTIGGQIGSIRLDVEALQSASSVFVAKTAVTSVARCGTAALSSMRTVRLYGACTGLTGSVRGEQATGIEPAFSAWEAHRGVLDDVQKNRKEQLSGFST